MQEASHGDTITRFRKLWADAHKMLTEHHFNKLGDVGSPVPYRIQVRADDDKERVDALMAQVWHEAKWFEAESKASKSLYGILGSLSLLTLVFSLAFASGGFLPWQWLPPLVGLLGLLADLAGAMILGLDALEMTKQMVMKASIHRAAWGGTAVEEAERLLTLQRERQQEVQKQWSVPRRGLILLFLGFLLQAISQAISMGTTMRG
jgi:hypothetical protein